jgi:hypothetical protein
MVGLTTARLAFCSGQPPLAVIGRSINSRKANMNKRRLSMNQV